MATELSLSFITKMHPAAPALWSSSAFTSFDVSLCEWWHSTIFPRILLLSSVPGSQWLLTRRKLLRILIRETEQEYVDFVSYLAESVSETELDFAAAPVINGYLGDLSRFEKFIATPCTYTNIIVIAS